jgi:hypothetical protein
MGKGSSAALCPQCVWLHSASVRVGSPHRPDVVRALLTDQVSIHPRHESAHHGPQHGVRGYPKSKDGANLVQSWILLPFHGGLPHGCHNS